MISLAEDIKRLRPVNSSATRVGDYADFTSYHREETVIHFLTNEGLSLFL